MKVGPLLELVDDWAEFLASGLSDEEADGLRRHERTGRPLGAERFVTRLERKLHRILRPQKRGPKPEAERKGRKTAQRKSRRN